MNYKQLHNIHTRNNTVTDMKTVEANLLQLFAMRVQEDIHTIAAWRKGKDVAEGRGMIQDIFPTESWL